MVKKIDARGLSCPQPVILAKRAIEEGQFPIEIIVETVTSRENVNRMAKNNGFDPAIEKIDNGEFKLILRKNN